LFDNLIDHAETEFGENYSHKMAILNRTGRKISIRSPNTTIKSGFNSLKASAKPINPHGYQYLG